MTSRSDNERVAQLQGWCERFASALATLPDEIEVGKRKPGAPGEPVWILRFSDRTEHWVMNRFPDPELGFRKLLETPTS